MKVKITGEAISPGDQVWLAPSGRRGKKLITVTATHRKDDVVFVDGIRADNKEETKATALSFEPVDMEV